MAQSIVIIDTGCANLLSVKMAFQRNGHHVTITDNHERIRQADKVILPGVGTAKSAMAQLKKKGLVDLIPTLTQPVLGICLGMQLLSAFSTENQQTNCLGIFDAAITPFTQVDRPIPHMGWNALIIDDFHPLFDGIPSGSYVYFVHSYAALSEQWKTFSLAQTDYGQHFAAIIQKNNFYGMQFHPEKSGKVGAKLLSNFVKL